MIRTPPVSYGASRDGLLIGRIYDLDAALAAALLVDGCAEAYDTLTPEERLANVPDQPLWESHDHQRSRSSAAAKPPRTKKR